MVFGGKQWSWLVIAAVAIPIVARAQREAITWDVPDSLATSDRQEILELADRVGIPQARRVSGGEGVCPSVYVEAPLAVRNREVRSSWTWLARTGGPGCARRGQSPRVGRWLSHFTRAETLEYWRISDGPWLVDVRQQNDLGYELVERIVLAARSMKWVERCAIGKLIHTASDIFNVTAAPLDPPDLDDGTHWISTMRRPPGALLGENMGLQVIVDASGRDIQFVRCSFWVT